MHTPGPWVVDLECSFTLGGDTVSIEALTPDHNVNREICTCLLNTDGHPSMNPGDEDRAEWEEDCANARLIAASPALYAACKAALDPSPCWYDHHGNCQGHGCGNPCPQKLIREAIALAEKGATK